MARIAGVNIPTNKRVEIALTYIHGIGRTKAKQITDKLGIGAGKARPGPDRPGSAPHPRERSTPTTRSRATCAAKRR